MIVQDAPRNVEVSGDFESTAFSLNATGKAFSVLSSGIYTNKIAAVIRELCCNAHDSHVEAGNPDPYDVHLPTRLEPWFEVRDYGTGLSHQDCMTVYTTYFHSTKTKSNDVVGCLGLGSKVGYAIADSFVVTSWFNGEKREYSAHKDSSDCPQFSLLSTCPTDEPNGISVKINVGDNRWQFEREAVNIIKYFDQIPNINSDSVKASVESAHDSLIIRGDGYALTPNNGDLKAVMGGIAYSIPHALNDWNVEGFIKFKIGDLNFNTGRETLVIDDVTRENIVTKIASVQEALVKDLLKAIDDEPTPFKKWLKFKSLNKWICKEALGKHKATYEIPKSPGIKFCQIVSRSVQIMETDVLPVDGDVEYFWTKPKFTSRIRQYVKSIRNKVVVLLTHEQAKDTLIDVDVIRDLDALPKIDRAKTVYTAETAKVFTIVDGRTLFGRDARNNFASATVDVKSQDEKVYVVIDRFTTDMGIDIIKEDVKHLNSLGLTLKVEDIYAVKKAMTLTKSFETGNWITYQNYIKREIANLGIGSVLTRPTGSTYKFIKALSKQTNNPLFLEFAAFENSTGKYIDESHMKRYYGVQLTTDDSLVKKFEEILEKYPLLTHLDQYLYSIPQEILDYVKG